MLRSSYCRIGFGSWKESSLSRDFVLACPQLSTLPFSCQFSSQFNFCSFSQLNIIFTTQNTLIDSATSAISVFTFLFQNAYDYVEHQRTQHTYLRNFCSEVSSTGCSFTPVFCFLLFLLAFILKNIFPV